MNVGDRVKVLYSIPGAKDTVGKTGVVHHIVGQGVSVIIDGDGDLPWGYVCEELQVLTRTKFIKDAVLPYYDYEEN